MKLIKLLMLAALSITFFSLSAQDTTLIKPSARRMQPNEIYSCPMHEGEKSNKPGKCDKCGMALTIASKGKKKMNDMKMYTCPMHADVTSKKPGKCSKCGMDLKAKD
jgi:hypothetical protein